MNFIAVNWSFGFKKENQAANVPSEILKFVCE